MLLNLRSGTMTELVGGSPCQGPVPRVHDTEVPGDENAAPCPLFHLSRCPVAPEKREFSEGGRPGRSPLQRWTIFVRVSIAPTVRLSPEQTVSAPLPSAYPVPLHPLFDLTSSLAESRLVSSKPTAPAVLCRHDAALRKLVRDFTEVAGIVQ